MKVGNYSYGGTVGRSMSPSGYRNSSSSQQTVYNQTSNFNIVTPSVSQFNESRSMLAQREKLAQDRILKYQ